MNKHTFNRNLLSAFVGMVMTAALAMPVSAITLDEAKEAFERGDYYVAVDELARVALREPKNTMLNQMAGIALMRTGSPSEAVKFLKLGQNESNLYLAELALDNYRLEEADQYLETYDKGLGKGRRRKEPSPMVEELEAKKNLITGMLDRVAAIEIVDSMIVEKDSFFKRYRLAQSAGTLNAPSILPKGTPVADPTVVYQSENGQNRIWAAPDENENYQLVRSSKLADGTWETPHPLGEVLNEGGDANYPFIMSDGVTLYFANDGENSLGGYDIFIASDNGDEFLQPQNMGMPFNSTADDYLLAIDEESGMGWWATDRNHLDGFITIYRFIPQEYRTNYPVDTPNLADLAFVKNIRDTWKPDKDYTVLLMSAENAVNGPRIVQRDFSFALPGGRVCHFLADFKSQQARNKMERYLDACDEMLELEDRLLTLREKWRGGDHRGEGQILTLESKIIKQRETLKDLANQVVIAETER